MEIEGYFIGTFKDNVFIMEYSGNRVSYKASENLVSFIANLFKLYEPIKLEVEGFNIKKIIL